jgi:hypothetical protein
MCVVLALAVPFAMNFIGGFDKMIDILEPSYFDTMGDLSIWLIIIYASTGLAYSRRTHILPTYICSKIL